MQWHAIFNAHFSVPVNFVLFVSLDIFLQLNFVSMNICHFFQLLRRLFCVTIRNLLDDVGISVCFFHPFRVIYWCSGKNVSSISISKYSFNEDFAKLQIKTSILESFIQGHLQAFLVCKKPVTFRGLCPFQTCKRKHA